MIEAVRAVEEVLEPGPVPLWVHPEWRNRFSWIRQGSTGRTADADGGDLGLFGGAAVGEVIGRWRALRETIGARTAVHSRQSHGAEFAVWTERLPDGLVVVDGYDAHLTTRTDVLLTVSVADCVPVFLVSEEPRVLALAHAGWRGTAAGILERGLAMMAAAGADLARIWLHCGPSICGRCYEVGPEVHAAVRPDSSAPETARPIDLRAALCERAAAAGLDPALMSVSRHCTRCGPGTFFSHRAGASGRQVGVLAAVA